MTYFMGQKLVSTQQARLMNKTYEILKPLTIEQLREMKYYSYRFTDQYYWALFMYCIYETIRRKKEGVWK